MPRPAALLLLAVCKLLLLSPTAAAALTPEEAQAWRLTAQEDFDWQQSEPDAVVHISGQGVADVDGNLYFAGSVSKSDVDWFVARVNADGSLGWTREYGTDETDAATFVTIVNETSSTGEMTQQLYVAGYTWGYLDEGGHALNGFGRYGGRDVALAKISLNGDKLWMRQFGTTANDFVYGVSLDGNFNTLLLSGGCETNQLDETVEVDVADFLESRTQAKGVSDYESQLMDPQPRTSTQHRAYNFAVNLNFGGDILDYAMDGGVTLTPRRQRIREGALVAEYAVMLNRQPLADVVVQAQDVRLLDPSGEPVHQLTFLTSQRVLFTPSTWNREQYVRVKAVDDALAEGRHYAIVTHFVSSADPNFDSTETPFLFGRNVTVQIDDNDRAGISLSRQHLFVAEGGGKDSYDVVLTSQPWHPVKVVVVPLHGNQTVAAPELLIGAPVDGTAELIFHPGDWDTPQRIVVSAVDDIESEAEYGGLYTGGPLLHYSESKDVRYHTRRPQCFVIPNCNPHDSSVCLFPDSMLEVGQTTVQVCDLTKECAFSLGNGACIANVSDGDGNVPARFGARPLDPGSTDTSVTFLSYAGLRDVLRGERNDVNLSVLSSMSGNVTSFDSNFLEPPAELRGFILGFLGLMNVNQARMMSASPKITLHTICAGLVRLETMRWAYEEWPTGYAERVLNAIFAMFPQSYSLERHAWNCGMARFITGNSIDVSIWDNDPGVTLSSASLDISEGRAMGAYNVVLNAPPSIEGLAQIIARSSTTQISSVYCTIKQSDTCGFWGEGFSALAATIYNQSTWNFQQGAVSPNVSIAIIGNSQVMVIPSLLTFTATNWFVPQRVMVLAVDDAVAEPDANYTISHQVQNSPYGYTNMTAFWFQGTLSRAGVDLLPQWNSVGGGNIPYNSVPTILRSPGHRQINVHVRDNDAAKVNVAVNQPGPGLATKEAIDTTFRWVGDYVTALAFDDTSLATTTTGGLMTKTAFSNILVFAANAITYMKFHLPQLHDGDTAIAFSGATLVLYQTPYKVFNISELQSSSNSSSSTGTSGTSAAQANFSKVYQLKVTVIDNAWAAGNIGTAEVSPKPLSFLTNGPSIEVIATVEKSRSIVIDISTLVAEVLPTRLSVMSLKIEVLSEGNNTESISTTQLCSSVFERKLRPLLSLAYEFPSILDGLAATQSSTAVSSHTNTALSASLATNGATYDDGANSSVAVATTNSEREPWWEVTLPQLTKLGTLAVFLPASFVNESTGSDVVNIVIVASLTAFNSRPLSLEEAQVYGCPTSCPHVQSLSVRKGILLWDVQAGAIAIRIYREGVGSLMLSQVQAFDSFIQVTPTADGSGIRSRSKASWGPNTAALQPWRLLQTVRKSEDENLVVGMRTRQSSTSPSDALSHIAVDGLRHSRWDPLFIQNESTSAMAAGSTRTDVEIDPWWEVDLGSIKPIRSVVLYPYVGIRYDELCAATTSSDGNGYPAWSGDLHNYSRVDPLLRLKAPFAQEFEILLSDLSLRNSDGTTSGAQATISTTLAFSCTGYSDSIGWEGIFSRARFVTVRKRGFGVLMLNEVEVMRWNPSTMSRYLLLDFFARGQNSLAVTSVQVFSPSDVDPTDVLGRTPSAPIPYKIHSVSSQLNGSGAGSANALLNTKDISQCYVANKPSFHEWVILDFGAPVRIGLIDVNLNVSQCSSVNVEPVTEFSVASHGSVLSSIRSNTAELALALEGSSSVCALTAMGVVVTPSSSCDTFICTDEACQKPLRAQDSAQNSVVLSDFVDIVVLGKAALLPVGRLPLSQNEHRALVLRDNPVVLWPFDDGVKMFVSPRFGAASNHQNGRTTTYLELQTVSTWSSLSIRDDMESTFFSTSVIINPAMSSFSMEFWALFGDNFALPATILRTYGLSDNGEQVSFGHVGIGVQPAQFFFVVANPADGETCKVVLNEGANILPIAGIWHQIVAIYDPVSSSISLSVCIPGQEQMTQCYTTAVVCNMAMLKFSQKVILFGASSAATNNATASSTFDGGFVGRIASVAWYVRALTSTEVLDHYHDFFDGVTAQLTGAHNTYSIRLSTKPLRSVIVKIHAEDTCYRFNLCNVSTVPSVLEFTSEDWSIPKLVHVLATDDQLYEGLHSSTISHSVFSSPSFALTSTASTISVNSASGGKELLQDLQILVASFFRDFIMYGTLGNTSVQLERQNALENLQAQWATQTIEKVAISANAYANNLTADPALVLITDLTVPGIEFSTVSLSVSEDGNGNDYQVVLLSEPTQQVQVALHITAGCYRGCLTAPLCPSHTVVTNGQLVASQDNSFLSCGAASKSMAASSLLCNITVTPDILNFSTNNWNLPQTVRVLAVDDHLDEANVHVAVISATSESLDPIYDQLVLPDIVVAIADNDDTGITYSTKFISLSENGIAQSRLSYPNADYYTLQLTTEPYASVTIAMSNEVDKACYRRCGYPFDLTLCGLPRQESVSLVRLRTNSTREIHQIDLRVAKITEVQRIVTYAAHVDQIVRLGVSGGFGLEVQTIAFQFDDAFKQRFTSSNAVTAASSYGGTFVVSNAMGASTTALDMFASAQLVQTALNGLFPGGSGAVNVTRELLYSQSTLTWNITFLRFVSADGTFPLLSVAPNSAIDGTVNTRRVQLANSPTGSFTLSYGSTTFQVPLLIAAGALQSLLSAQTGIYSVNTSRGILDSADYGFDYRITFTSVASYKSLRLNTSSNAVPAAGAASQVVVSLSEVQSPVQINGAFVIDYISPYNATNPTKPNRTAPVFWNDTADVLASKLAQLHGVGNVTVSCQRLSGEGGMSWTIQFLENHGNLPSMIATSVNLTGRGVTVGVTTVRDGEPLRGNFSVQMGGWFKKTDPRTSRAYMMSFPLKNTTLLPFNATRKRVQTALFALGITELANVSRTGVDCDAFNVCNGYTWVISYTNSPGNLPPIAVFADDYMRKAPGLAISATTVANGTYLGGSFSLRLDLLDPDTNVSYVGTTWRLPVNVSAVGMDEALEALSFVRSDREAEYDPETKVWRGIKFDKGVRVYREGPYLDGGHTWRLEWALEDYLRFADLKITMDVSLVTQEIEPLPVSSELDLLGKPRCSSIPNAFFQPDTTDPLGLRGYCVYGIANVTEQERFLCNYTVLNPWIVFTPENWCIPQQIRLQAVDDYLDEHTVENGSVTFSKVTHSAYSDDYIYLALPLPNVTVRVESNDAAKVLVSESALEVSEDGSLVAQYFLQLNSEPLANVKIIALPWLDSNNTQCYRFGLCNVTLPVTEFWFTPQNWNVQQVVAVRATDDNLDEYDTHTTGISHLSYSDDPKYNAITSIPTINVKVYDNDVSGFVVNKTSVFVTEGIGFVDSYSVVLTSEPFAKVTTYITNVGTVGNLAVVSPTELVFTWRTWNVSQTVEVAAFDDHTQDAIGSSSTLNHSLTSNDLIYGALRDLTAVSVFITDNDGSGLELSTRSLRGPESNTSVLQYSVRLTSEPWRPVIIQPNASHDCYLRLQTAQHVCNASIVYGSTSLYFGATNWSAWQNISLIAVDDWLDEADVHTARISHASWSSDPLYAVNDYEVSGGDITLYITDNDVSFVNISVQSATNQLHVAEGSFNDSYTISLNSEPYQYVTVSLRPTINKIASFVDPKSIYTQPQVGALYGSFASSAITLVSTNVIRSIDLIFTPLDWARPRSVTVFAIDDGIPEAATQFSTITHSVSSADANYNISNSSIGVVGVAVMINDREAIPPPLPVNATFDSTGSKVNITFDSPVYHAASMAVSASKSFVTRLKTFPCSLVFNLASAKYSLGPQSFCLWLDGKNLRIELSTGATLAAADKLVLNDCSSFVDQYCNATDVLRAGPSSRAFSQASIAVQVPYDIVQPNVVLATPDNAGSCGAWSVDASLSSGSGGRPFSQLVWFALPASLYPVNASISATGNDILALYQRLNMSFDILCQKYAADWKTGKSSITLVPAADIAQATARSTQATSDLLTLSTMAQLRAACYLRSVVQNATVSGAMQFQVNSSLLAPSAAYHVGLKLVNAFAQAAIVAKSTNLQSLPGPAVFIVGDSFKKISRVGDPVLIQADSVLSCPSLLNAKVAYRWTTASQNSSDASSITTEDFSKSNSARDPRVFRLARSLLQAGRTYNFTVEAFISGMSSNQSSSSFASIVVSITSSEPQIFISGGECALGVRDSLVLDGSATVDPDASNDPFTYAWECLDVTNATTSSSKPAACVNASTKSLSPLDLSSKTGAILKLAPFNLVPGRQLIFLMTASKGTRSATASTSIWTLLGHVPKVNVTASATKINPSNRLVLTSVVSSDYPYTARWTQTQGDLVLPNATNSNISDAFSLPLTSISNSIPSYKLTAGLMYEFRLVATDSQGNVGFGSVSVVINSPPTSGTFTASPRSGYAMQDAFTLTCSLWNDDVNDYPLTYAFGVIPTSDFEMLKGSSALVAQLQRSVTPLVPSQVSPKAMTTVLPPENMQDSDNLTIVAFISDRLGAVTVAYDTIQIEVPGAANLQPVAFASSLLLSNGTEQSTGNSILKVRQALSAARVLEKALGSSSSASSPASSRRLATSCPDGLMGPSCTIQTTGVQQVDSIILMTLSDAAQSVEASSSGLGQLACVLGSIMRTTPEVLSAENVTLVTQLCSGIANSALGLDISTDFLDWTGDTLLEVILATVALRIPEFNSNLSVSVRRLAESTAAPPADTTHQAGDSTCNNVVETVGMKENWDNVVRTLQSLAALSSQEQQDGEQPAVLEFSDVSTFSSKGVGSSAVPKSILAVNLTLAAIACLNKDIYLDIFTFVTIPHSLCTLNNSQPISRLTLFSVHSQVAFDQAAASKVFSPNTGIATEMLASTSACIAQASKSTQGLGSDGGSTETTKWVPLVVLTIPHTRELSAIEQSHFSTSCRTWDTEASSWTANVCYKDDSTSTSDFTVCYCTEIEDALEVLVTLEERLDFYALHPDLYRNDPPSLVVSITLAILVGVFVLVTKVGQRVDTRDVQREKITTIKRLNRAKWGELQARTQASNVFEDFESYYVAQKMKRLESRPSETQTMIITDVGDSSVSGSRILDASFAAPSTEPLDPAVQLPDEARTLFGSSNVVDRQYARVTMLFKVSNLLLVLIGIVLLLAGIEMQFVLGRTPTEIVLYLYGGPLGIALMVGGAIFLTGGISGVYLSRREASNAGRTVYLASIGIALLVQFLVVVFTFHSIENFDNLPRGVALALRSRWNSLSLGDKSQLQASYGCCGFLAINEEVLCPEEALEAIPPRTCSMVMGVQASELFSSSFIYVQGAFAGEIACIALANLLIRWRRIRLLQLATSDLQSSAEASIVRSPVSVVLLCSLPPLYTILACVAGGAALFGVDLMLHSGFMADPVVAALFGVEVGGFIVSGAVMYLLITLRALHVVGTRDVRALRWIVMLSLVFLLVTIGVYGYLNRLVTDFYLDPSISEAIEAKYVALTRSTMLLKLEMAMVCCGFRYRTQGVCVEDASTNDIPTCQAQVNQALIRALSLATDRLIVFAVAQSMMILLTMWTCFRLWRFRGLAAIRFTVPELELPTVHDPPSMSRKGCVVGLVLLSLGAVAVGLGFISLGLDVLLELNILQISYLLRVFDRRLGVYLLSFGGAVELFAVFGCIVAWMGTPKTFRRPSIKTRMKWLTVCYAAACAALFVGAFTVMGVAHKLSSKLSPPTFEDATNDTTIAIDTRLKDLWSSAPSTTKQFVQNTLQCCGYERVDAANGSVSYTLQAEQVGWRRLTSKSTYNIYKSRNVSDFQKRTLMETQGEAVLLNSTKGCPLMATDGCASPMKRYVSRVSRIAWHVCGGLAGYSVIALLCVSGLVDFNQRQKTWRPCWRLRIMRAALLIMVLLGTLAALACVILGVDVAAGWTLFSSSALQLMFARSIGTLLILYGVLALLAHAYSARAALQFSVHQLFLQCVARLVLLTALLAAVGFTAHLSHYSSASETSWYTQLTSFLDDQWSGLRPAVQHEIALEFSCCGFNNPVLITGKGVVFDRPALGYPKCSIAISRGCKVPLVKGVESSFAWLFALFLSLAVMEAMVFVMGAFLLRGVRRYDGEAWFVLESKLRYVAGSFRRDFRRHHILVSVGAHFDARLTRPQRAVSVLCGWAASLAVFAGYFATRGCYRTALRTCEQPGVGELLGLGLVYGGMVGFAVQTTTIMLFKHIRNRADDETKEVATARQRKEKVLLFRKPWFRRHHQCDIQESSQTMGQPALANEPSTLDTTQSTTEERWFVWLTRFVAATFQVCAVLLFLGGCALATLIGLLRLGYNNSLYGVPLDEDAPELLGVAFGLVVVALIAALANDLREQQIKRPHRSQLTRAIVALAAVAVAALIALGAVLLTIFMMHEVVQEDANALTSWSVRTTGFSVVERLETVWKEELTGYFKDTVQQELHCCGFLGPTDAPFLPCPEGDRVQVTYQALTVSGTVVDKTQEEYTELPGCRLKMLARFQHGADVATYCAIAAAGLLFLLVVNALFLTRELAISKDAKLKLRVPDPIADAEEVEKDIRETFETVVGLKISAPTRGKLRSQLLASSLESVAPTVASELAAAPLKHEQLLIATTPSADEHVPDDEMLDENHGIGQKLENTAKVNTVDDTTNVPYPASIVYVVFMICLLWLVAMAYIVAISAMELGVATSWRCVLAWAIGVAMQELLVEPAFIFASIVTRTMQGWWSHTLVAKLIRYGRAALRIGPHNAGSLDHEHTVKSLSLYDRLRYAAAVRIQRRLLTRVTRARYLQQLRAHKQKLHRTLEAQRRETLRKTLSNFSDEEVEAFRLLFVSADAAQLGLISHTSIAQAVYELGVHVPAPKVRELLEAFDPAYADLVDFEHFLYGMHCVRNYHQHLQSQATNLDQPSSARQRIDPEKLVSSSDRFGPSADPRAELLVKRQNMLRELRDRRETLAHKLLRKVGGRLPSLTPRGKSTRPSTAVDQVSVGPPLIDDAMQPTATNDAPAQPTGTYVFWQNRRLSPKKRALESVLKKKHKERLRLAQRQGAEVVAEKVHPTAAASGNRLPEDHASSTRRALKNLASKKTERESAKETVTPDGRMLPAASEEEEEEQKSTEEVSPAIGDGVERTDASVKPESATTAAETKAFGSYLLLAKQVPPLHSRVSRAEASDTPRPVPTERAKAPRALEKALLKKQQQRKP